MKYSVIASYISFSSSNITAEASKRSNDVKTESDKTESKAKSAGKKKGGSPKKRENVKAIEEEVSGIVNNVGRHKRHFKTDGERIEKFVKFYPCLVKMELHVFNTLPMVSALQISCTLQFWKCSSHTVNELLNLRIHMYCIVNGLM